MTEDKVHSAPTRELLIGNISNRAKQIGEFTNEHWARVGTDVLVELDHEIESLHDALVRARILTHDDFKAALQLMKELEYDPETPQAEGMFAFLCQVWASEADKSSTGWEPGDVKAEFLRVYGGGDS
jgi:hypothetical protein